MAVKHTAEVTVYDVTDAYSVTLTNEATSLKATATDKLGTASTATTKPQAFLGTDAVACSVTAADCVCSDSTNVSVSVNSSGDNATWPLITISIGANTANSGTVTIPVVIGTGDDAVTIEKVFSYSIALKGTGGTAAYNYFLNVSPSAIVRSESGTLSVSSVAWASTRAQGTGTPAAYSGYVWSHYSTDGSTWTQIAKATSAASSGTVTVPSAATATVKYVRVTLHTASPTDANKVDSVTVPVIDAGATGPAGDSITVSSVAYAYQLSTSGTTVPTGTWQTTPQAPTTTQYAWTRTTVTFSDNSTSTTYAVGGKTGTNGTSPTVTNSKTQYQLSTSGTAVPTGTWSDSALAPTTTQFCWTKTTVTYSNGNTAVSYAVGGKVGAKGDRGDCPYTLSITSDNGTVLKNNSGQTTLTAHVYQDGAELSTMPSGCSVKWYVDGTLTETDTSLPATFTRTAAQVTNKCVVCAKLEG